MHQITIVDSGNSRLFNHLIVILCSVVIIISAVIPVPSFFRLPAQGFPPPPPRPPPATPSEKSRWCREGSEQNCAPVIVFHSWKFSLEVN